MTINIKVTNQDSRETAVVAVRTINAPGKTSLMPIVNFSGTELKGGESTTIAVYKGQSLLVEEVQNG